MPVGRSVGRFSHLERASPFFCLREYLKLSVAYRTRIEFDNDIDKRKNMIDMHDFDI